MQSVENSPLIDKKKLSKSDSFTKLDHVLSSCIVVMVHVVKGRLYSAYTLLHAGTSIAEVASVIDSTSIVTDFDVGTTLI